jgi:putative ABC transport system substrate-binding protein
MRRRKLATLLLGVAGAAWPLSTRAQQPDMPVIGYLHAGSLWLDEAVAAFRRGLSDMGYVDGQNVAIEYRWAEGQSDRLPLLAADLVNRRVAVIVAVGGPAPALAARAVTSTIPIVFLIGSDPIREGLVTSLSRPDANVTGLTLLSGTVGEKRLQLIRELLPAVTEIAVLVSPLIADPDTQLLPLRPAARTMQLQLLPLTVANEGDLETAFATVAGRRPSALFVLASPFFEARRDQIVAFAARQAIPAIYAWREFVVRGGLMSYGASLANMSRQTGAYTGRILRGERPANLPVQQATTFELVINLATARALGLTVPATLLARADEVIE